MVTAFAQVWRNPFVRVVVALVAAYGLYELLVWSRPVWGSLLLAYVVAYLLHPMLDWFVRRGLGRGLGMVAVVAGVVAFLLVLWLVGVRAAAQLSTLAGELPALLESVRSLPFIVARVVDPSYGEVFHRVFGAGTGLVTQVENEVAPFLASLPRRLFTRLLAANTGAVLTMGVLVLAFYLLYDFGRYNRAFLRAVPPRYRPAIVGASGRIGSALAAYVRGQLLLSVAVGTMIGGGLALIGVPLALVVGIVTTIGNMIPLVGPVVAAVPSLLLALMTGWLETALTIGLLLVVQFLDGNLLTPMVHARVVSLDKVTVLLAVLIGAVLFGLIGALLAVPVAVVATMVYTDLYLESRWYRGGDGTQPTPPEDAEAGSVGGT